MQQPINSGDLLLFSGTGTVSRAIKLFTGHFVSHAAIAFRCPVTNQLYVWEMGDVNFSGPMITRLGRSKETAHLVSLKEKVKSYNGDIYVRKLSKTIDQPKFERFIATNLGKQYNSNLVSAWNDRGNISLISLPFLNPTKKRESSEDWMCSQLVAATYNYLGITTNNIPDHEMMPFDYWGEIETSNGYSFSVPLQIIYKTLS
jgi:hypothetical protein